MKTKTITVSKCFDCPFIDREWSSCNFPGKEYSKEMMINFDDKRPGDCPLNKKTVIIKVKKES